MLPPGAATSRPVAVLFVRQSMACTALAGMLPQAGLYSASVSLPVYALLGTSSFISLAPLATDSCSSPQRWAHRGR
jgi:MFS superfamily sulfate permease-like transporter